MSPEGSRGGGCPYGSHRWRWVLQVPPVVPQILLGIPWVEMCPSDPTGGPTGRDGSFRSYWLSHRSFRSYWWSYGWRCALQILLVVPQVLQILLVVPHVEMCPSDPIGGSMGRDVSFRSYWWSHRWRFVLQIPLVVPQILLVVPQVEMCPSDPIGGPTGRDGSFRSYWLSHRSFRSYWWSYGWRCALQILLVVPQVLQILLVVPHMEMCPSDPIGGPTRGDVSFRSYWWFYG